MRYTTIAYLASIVLGSAPASLFAQDAEITIREHCTREWPSDNEMRAYCERQQGVALTALGQLQMSKGGLRATDFEQVLLMCSGEWVDDFRMTVYCLKQQIQGYGDVSRGPSRPGVEPTAEELSTIESHCAQEWSEDFQMRSYCQKQQMEGLAYLKADPPMEASTDVWNRELNRCRGEWATDFQMQAYCVRQRFP